MDKFLTSGSMKFLSCLKIKKKGCALSFNALYFYIPLVQQHDLFAEAQTYTTAGFAGTEERNEYLFHQFC